MKLRSGFGSSFLAACAALMLALGRRKPRNPRPVTIDGSDAIWLAGRTDVVISRLRTSAVVRRGPSASIRRTRSARRTMPVARAAPQRPAPRRRRARWSSVRRHGSRQCSRRSTWRSARSDRCPGNGYQQARSSAGRGGKASAAQTGRDDASVTRHRSPPVRVRRRPASCRPAPRRPLAAVARLPMSPAGSAAHACWRADATLAPAGLAGATELAGDGGTLIVESSTTTHRRRQPGARPRTRSAFETRSLDSTSARCDAAISAPRGIDIDGFGCGRRVPRQAADDRQRPGSGASDRAESMQSARDRRPRRARARDLGDVHARRPRDRAASASRGEGREVSGRAGAVDRCRRGLLVGSSIADEAVAQPFRRRVRLARRLPENAAVPGRKEGVGGKLGIDLGQLELVGARQGEGVDLGAADDEDPLARRREVERGVQRCGGRRRLRRARPGRG